MLPEKQRQLQVWWAKKIKALIAWLRRLDADIRWAPDPRPKTLEIAGRRTSQPSRRSPKPNKRAVRPSGRAGLILSVTGQVGRAILTIDAFVVGITRAYITTVLNSFGRMPKPTFHNYDYFVQGENHRRQKIGLEPVAEKIAPARVDEYSLKQSRRAYTAQEPSSPIDQGAPIHDLTPDLDEKSEGPKGP